MKKIIILSLIIISLFFSCKEIDLINPITEDLPIYQDRNLFELGTITFYENENIESGTLKNNNIIDGIAFRNEISFYHNGENPRS